MAKGKPKINLTITLDLSKIPIPLKEEWLETIECLKKLPNVKIIGAQQDE